MYPWSVFACVLGRVVGGCGQADKPHDLAEVLNLQASAFIRLAHLS